ncbi:MAG TPA: Rieske 2Fe-2S domain-containing protein [bacterium]|nr:Rieske 2Fe-2S domain-containing protein [bacterium]
MDRRGVLIGIGWGGLGALAASSGPALVRFLMPRATSAAGATVDVGTPADYRDTLVSVRWVNRHGLWIVRRDGRLFALEARCTHLGCKPRWVPGRDEFLCPCHGSRFTPDGEALNGPAVTPLARLALRDDRGRLCVDPATKAGLEEGERDPRFFVPI